MEILLGLLVAVIPLVALARRFDVSYPIVLVVGGLILGFIPGLPHIELDPNLVLLIFLPPLLYWESITAPTDVMFENAGQIALLAIGLVIATTVAVAIAAHTLIPNIPWAIAFVLGAIVSPTDELAAVPVLQQFHLPRQLVAIVDGESLLNDATALIIYATAIAAASASAFQPGMMVGAFALIVIGSITLGAIAGRIGVELWRAIDDPQLQGVISVVIPFLAYLPAQRFGLSGVLAVVTAGVFVNRRNARVVVPAARTQLLGFWNTIVFLANVCLFLVVGLQLHEVANAAFRHESWQAVIGYALVVNAVIVAVRISLALLAEYAPTSAPSDHAAPNWKNAFVVAWSGLRGAVSLAAALALPLALPDGTAFPHRDLIVFITFSVILVTLVGGGLTLPSVVRALGIEEGNEEQDEIRRALIRTAEAALARITELESEARIDAEHAGRLRESYEHRISLQQPDEDGRTSEHVDRHIDVKRELIAAQRRALIAMREDGEIDNVGFRTVQARLDNAGEGALL